MPSPLIWAGLLALAVCAYGQDIDSEVTPHTARNSFTILDQVANPAERAAFQQLYRERDLTKRRDLAIQFEKRFSDSWLLGQAYEIVAKASIELDDASTALDYGQRSLRLWPENPLLLVPLANLQAKEKLFYEASRSASDALRFLDRFDHPASIPEKNWPQLQLALRASSYFVLGRVAAARGFESAGPTKDRYLAEAGESLRKAWSLDPSDPEAAYLEGLVLLGLKKPNSAAPFFAETYRIPGALQEAALEQLRTLYREGPTSKAPAGFESYVSSLKLEVPPAEKASSSETPLPPYAGSEACSVCHPQEYTSWKQTGMGRMFRPYRPENVLADFSHSTVIRDEAGMPAISPVLDHGKAYFDVRNTENRWTRFPVQFTIGSKWQQAYATKFDDGRIQVFPIQYNALQKRWINYWKLTDAAGSERTQIGTFAAAVPGATYQVNCAPCHTSQLSFGKGIGQPQAAVFREGGIDCEMCHGPSGEHAAAMHSGKPAHGTPATPPVDFKKLNANEFVAICSQCHLQSGLRTPDPEGAVNFSPSGNTFYRVSLSRPYVDFSRKAFYKDGRFRVTTFIVESFVRSRCFREGQAQCGSCHNPHPADPASNPASLKFAGQSDQICLQCHAALKAQQESHTHHALSSEGSRCVSCHMPKIMESLLFNARSHQIDDVPSAPMTSRFGNQESPNACLLCHRDKGNDWLTQQLQSWQGTKNRRTATLVQ